MVDVVFKLLNVFGELFVRELAKMRAEIVMSVVLRDDASIVTTDRCKSSYGE